MPDTATLTPPSTTAAKPIPVIAGAHEKPPSEYTGDMDAVFAEMDAEGQGDNPRVARDSKGRITAKVDPKEEKKVEETEVKKVDDTTTKKEDEPKPGTMRALGKAHDALKKERDEVLMPELTSLRAKAKDQERAIAELTARQPDVKPMQERLTALEKENTELHKKLEFSDYKNSKPYLKDIKGPLDSKWSDVISELDGFTVGLADGTTRPVTVTDIGKLAELNLKQRGELAREWFGDSAPTMLGYVKDLIDLSKKHDAALKQAEQTSGEYKNKQTAEATQKNAALSTNFSTTQTELRTKYPKWFSPVEGDVKGNELLKQGQEEFKSVFGANGKLTPEEKSRKLAKIGEGYASFLRMAHWHKLDQARIKELETDLAEYEKSGALLDGGGDPNRVGEQSLQEELDETFKKMDRMGR